MVATDALSIPSVVPVPRVPPQLPVPRPSRPTPGPRPRATATARFPDTPEIYPWLARRFGGGEATLFTGPARTVEALLELLYAGCVAAGGRLSLLEGANRFHPYRIAERVRALGADPERALERIRLARAFTGYQMAALVEAWAREVRRHRPTLLVAHEIPALFFATEFPVEERTPLLSHLARTLAGVARSTGLPVLVTSTGGLAGFPGLAEEGPRLFDLVRLRPGPVGVELEAYRESTRLRLLDRPDGQRGLEEFGGAWAGEVMAWDARSRPTGRRSRSG